MQTNYEALIEAECANIEKFLNRERGEELISAEEAEKAADTRQNLDLSQGGGFKENDILIFPTGKIRFIGVKNTQSEGVSLSFIALLQRNGRVCGFRVYPSWLTLSTHPLKEETRAVEGSTETVKVEVPDMERWVQHTGVLAEEARAFVGSVKEMVCHFQGKAFKITRASKTRVEVIDGSAGYDAVNKRWHRKPGSRKFYNYVAIDNPIATDSDTNAAVTEPEE